MRNDMCIEWFFLWSDGSFDGVIVWYCNGAKKPNLRKVQQKSPESQFGKPNLISGMRIRSSHESTV